MGNQTRALGLGLLDVLQLLQHPRPVRFAAIEQDEIDLTLILYGQLLHPVHFLAPVGKVGHQTVNAPAGFAKHPTNAQ